MEQMKGNRGSGNVLVDVTLPTGKPWKQAADIWPKKMGTHWGNQCGVNENDITFASQTGGLRQEPGHDQTPSDAINNIQIPYNFERLLFNDRRKPRAGRWTWTVMDATSGWTCSRRVRAFKSKEFGCEVIRRNSHIVVVQVRVRLLADPHTVSRIAAAEKLKQPDRRTGDPSRHYGKPRHP
jgi:threonine synthase